MALTRFRVARLVRWYIAVLDRAFACIWRGFAIVANGFASTRQRIYAGLATRQIVQYTAIEANRIM